jgi:ThiJ/PfpI family-like
MLLHRRQATKGTMCFSMIFAITRTICIATLLTPLPDSDFDPTESGLPWRTMRDQGHNVVFATPTGRTGRADPKMVTGAREAPIMPVCT